jgi:hypothetical protein
MNTLLGETGNAPNQTDAIKTGLLRKMKESLVIGNTRAWMSL